MIGSIWYVKCSEGGGKKEQLNRAGKRKGKREGGEKSERLKAGWGARAHTTTPRFEGEIGETRRMDEKRVLKKIVWQRVKTHFCYSSLDS